MNNLFKHQQDIINAALNSRYFACLADMGTGKTRCAIELIRVYASKNGLTITDPQPGKIYYLKPFRTLVIAPNTILENWKEEVAKWSTLSAVVLQGTKAKRLKLLAQLADVYIINYEALRLLESDLITKKFDMVIADESQKLKGYKTLQSKAAFRIAQKAQYRIIMTGTPITNNPLDIFGQYRFLNPFIFGFSYFKFRARYCILGGYMNYEVKKWINLEELKEKVYSCAIRIKKEDCLSLPDKLYEVHQVDLTADQARVYKQLRTEFISELAGKVVSAPYVLTRLLRLSQVTAGFIKDIEAQEINFTTNPKLVLLKEIIEALPVDEKVVIFCRFIKEIHNVMALCQDNKWSWTAIYGETKERQVAVNDFNSGKVRIFIGQVETAGLGINLHTARYCIFLSNSYSHGSRLQCEDRLHRIGQRNAVTYIDIVARDTIDLTVLNCLKDKKDLAATVIEEMKND